MGVVFGAAVKSSGRLFGALLYRTNTAIHLYKVGKIKKLLFSGSDQGYSGIGETEAMRIHARRSGVPEKDILLDRYGHDTQKSIANTQKIVSAQTLSQKEMQHILFISQGYHLARIRFIARRYGFSGKIFAAQDEMPLEKQHFFEFREIFAYLFDLLFAWPQH